MLTHLVYVSARKRNCTDDEMGKGLLIAGGVTGVTGTILMVDAFKFLGRASGKRSP